MGRLIDADDLIKEIDNDNNIFDNCKRRVRCKIAIAPTAESVRVVMCKDCKFGFQHRNESEYMCGQDGESHSAEFFCAGGEKKEEQDKIKPCPFCGSDKATPCIEYNYNDVDMWSVQCKDCLSSTWYYTTQKEAIEAWNKRS